jgi:hypothetical protein
VCYAAGMTGYLNANGIRIFDYPEFAKTLRDRVRERAASLAAEAGVTIEHVGKAHIRKEDVVARVLAERGDHPGLVHIISAMEACDACKPWHDIAATHRQQFWRSWTPRSSAMVLGNSLLLERGRCLDCGAVAPPSAGVVAILRELARAHQMITLAASLHQTYRFRLRRPRDELSGFGPDYPLR